MLTVRSVVMLVCVNSAMLDSVPIENRDPDCRSLGTSCLPGILLDCPALQSCADTSVDWLMHTQSMLDGLDVQGTDKNMPCWILSLWQRSQSDHRPCWKTCCAEALAANVRMLG